jgi:hypothetical protein
MKELTKQDVIKRLQNGCRLSGNITSEVPFGLVDLANRGFTSYRLIPSKTVRELMDEGLLEPDPQPRKINYRIAAGK